MPFTVIAFDSDTARRLSRAFDLAWNYLEENPDYLFVSAELAREDLALAIIDLASLGEVRSVFRSCGSVACMSEITCTFFRTEFGCENTDPA